MKRNQKGFTLIELLIVVAIIGIIVAIAIPNLLNAIQRAKQKRTMGDMRSAGTAAEAYAVDFNHYPAAAGYSLPTRITFGSTTFNTGGGGVELQRAGHAHVHPRAPDVGRLAVVLLLRLDRPALRHRCRPARTARTETRPSAARRRTSTTTSSS